MDEGGSLRAGVREDLSLPVERLQRLHDGVTSSPRSVLDRRVAAAQKVLSGCPSAIDAEAFARTCALVGTSAENFRNTVLRMVWVSATISL